LCVCSGESLINFQELQSYNASILKRLSALISLLSCLLLGLVAHPLLSQTAPRSIQTVLILPFENESKAPGLEWISEAFPEVLGDRLSAAHYNVIGRDDRNYAFDRFGLPAAIHPSRATLYRLAEQIDADYVVTGHYSYDGQSFTCSAVVLDMKALRMSDPVANHGALTALIEVQTGLAWQVINSMAPGTLGTREDFVRRASPIRLDAFENYIRGVVASDRTEKIKRLREAVRLNPQYSEAVLALGRTYFDNREYESAGSWLARIPKSDEYAGEANFLLGLSQYYSGEFDKADASFRFLESRLPLTEVENNLGVVAARRGRRNAVEYFQKAVQLDPNDPDYRFNLGLSLYKSGDSAGAARQLREAIAHKPNDVESRELLNTVSGFTPAASTSPGSRTPLERIKRNYDESSYRQLALEIENAMEQTLAKADPKTHAQYHADHGRELLERGLIADADREFREAVMLDPTNAKAHAGLARIAESKGDINLARREAETSLQLQPTADAYIVQGRLDLKDNHLDNAEKSANQALALEPNNPAAASLKRDVVSKQTMP
jgi:Flp pilus assembly protein TadD/TolB-like protein